MKDRKAPASDISKARFKLQNPYAYLDEFGRLDASIATPADMRECDSHMKKSAARARLLLKNPYAYINEFGELDAALPINNNSVIDDDRVKRVRCERSFHKNERIESLAREVHLRIWKDRKDIWPEGVPSDPVQMLDPELAINLLGFDFRMAETLGVFEDCGVSIEVAGLLDRATKRISISRRLPSNTRRFTAAHELGHVLMHREAVMHRDRPIDGSKQLSNSRAPIEAEADKFAAYFLMPEKLVRSRFKQLFLEDTFVVNEHTEFAFGQPSVIDALRKCETTRDFARILSRVERYNGRDFYCLADQFNVSVEAMAIRIEELGLIGQSEDEEIF